MKWDFRCHHCGLRWIMQHRMVDKAAFLQPKKLGRPVLECAGCNAECVGSMIQ